MSSPQTPHEHEPTQETAPPADAQQEVPWRTPTVPQELSTSDSLPPFPPPYLPPPAGWRPGYRQESQELSYHRLALADPKHRWWAPLVEAVIGAPIYVVLALVCLFITSAVLIFQGLNIFGLTTTQLETLALQNPSVFALFFGSVALMFPCLWLARIIVGPKPWGLIHSVEDRLRWRWLVTCTAIAAALCVLLPLGIDVASGASYPLQPKTSGSSLMMMLAFIILIVPFQAYAEELVFRGFLMQSIGRWLKHPAWAIVLPAPLFMLGHLYDLWGQLSVLVMGLAAGYITWRTGGLEAAIALHTVNNIIAMTFGVFGLADPFLHEGSNLAGFISSLVTNSIFVLVVVLLAKKNLARTRPAQVWVKEQPVSAPEPVR